MTKEQARKKLVLAASRQGLKVQMKSGKVKDAIRILNASGKVVAEGTLALDASKGYVNSDVQKTVNQINTKLGKRSMNASRRRKMNCASTVYTEALSPKEMDMIKDIFRKNDVSIESTSNSTGEDDGVVFREYLVRTGDTNSLNLGYLQDDLRMLEESHDIGYWDEENENGFYAKDYHFFHYPEDTDASRKKTNASKRRKMNSACSDKKKMNASDDDYIQDDAEFVEDVESVVTDEQGNEIVVEEMLVVQNPETNEISLFVPTEEDEAVPENVEVIGEVVTADDETTLDSSRKRVKMKASKRARR